MKHYLQILSFFIFLLPLCSFSADSDSLNNSLAQSRTVNNGLNNSQAVSTELSTINQQGLGLATLSGSAKEIRSGILLPGEAKISDLLPHTDKGLSPPFGANIFAGGYETERVDGINDNYLISSGDKISIWLWGAVNYSDVTTVDNQGNIFIPKIGPILVKDTPANKVNALVEAKVKSIYKKNVQTYINLLTATPISVFITGNIIRPGQYAGLASDSLLYFLKRAGGIDSDRGSYRNIHILRNNKVFQVIDLYEFITKGKLHDLSFKDGDVILVNEQASVVNVAGDVKNPFRFEFINQKIRGSILLSYAKPLVQTSHVAISGSRNGQPFSIYLPLKEFKEFELKNGDDLFFNEDQHAQVFDIKIEGSHLGASYFTVNKRTKLHDLLNNIEVDDSLADVGSISILRQSVAIKEKQLLNESLDRLEKAVFFAPTSSTGEATIRIQEAQLLTQFIERARTIEPLGRVVVSDKGIVANIMLEQGDTIVIPPKTDLIQIGGEVLRPQAVIYNKNATLEDYIAWAGGYTERANYKSIIITHANGLSEHISLTESWIDSSTKTTLQPGDRIVISPKIETKTIQAVKDITQILFQIAIAANAID